VVKFSEDLIRGIQHVNQDVVYDLPARASKAVIAETCIDAGRLATWGHKEADEEVRRLVEEHGYDAVLREASKHVCGA
jgi:thiamine biosynthesis lipoprotein ApbE